MAGTLYAGLVVLLALASFTIMIVYLGDAVIRAIHEQQLLYEQARYIAEHANITPTGLVELPERADIIIIDPAGIPHIAVDVERIWIPWDPQSVKIYVVKRGDTRTGASDPIAPIASVASTLLPTSNNTTATSDGYLDPWFMVLSGSPERYRGLAYSGNVSVPETRITFGSRGFVTVYYPFYWGYRVAEYYTDNTTICAKAAPLLQNRLLLSGSVIGCWLDYYVAGDGYELLVLTRLNTSAGDPTIVYQVLLLRGPAVVVNETGTLSAPWGTTNSTTITLPVGNVTVSIAYPGTHWATASLELPGVGVETVSTSASTYTWGTTIYTDYWYTVTATPAVTLVVPEASAIVSPLAPPGSITATCTSSTPGEARTLIISDNYQCSPSPVFEALVFR